MVLPHSSNIHLQTTKIDRKARSLIKGHRPAVLWFTGLSGAGKSTIASLTEQKLAECGAHTMLLDGDNVRHGLNRDLGFVDADRVENVRRIAEVSKLMYNAGLITLVSFISPFRQERQLARAMVDGGDFFEVFVDIPLEVAEKRDVKGLYAKARAGKLPNFTGIDSRYEAPLHPEITLATDTFDAEDAAEVVLEHLSLKGVVNR